MIDEDNEICAKLFSAKDLYLIILNLILKPNIHWEETLKMILEKDDIEWRQNVQLTILQQITKIYIKGYYLRIWGLLEKNPCKLCD